MTAARDFKYIFSYIIEKTAERYELDLGDGSEFKIQPLLTQYRGAGGKTRLEIFYGFPSRSVTIHTEDDGYKVDLRRGFFVFDESWNELHRSVERRRLVLDSVQDASGSYYILDRYHPELLPEPPVNGYNPPIAAQSLVVSERVKKRIRRTVIDLSNQGRNRAE